jgi:hypothetical protein
MMKRVLSFGAVVVVLTTVLYAAASYPSSVKSFSTKLAGQTISASHVNEIQDEIVAVETALLNGFTHALKPTVTGAQDLGTSSLHWGTIYANAFAGGAQDFTCGRLTLETGIPVSSTDQTAKTTLYYTPNGCDALTLYDGSAAWATVTFTELSIAVPATTSQLYDVFAYNNSGTAALELLAWTSDTARATALIRQNGRWVKTGATTRRYLGSMRTSTVSGQTTDSAISRLVWNAYHRVDRPLTLKSTTGAWTYNAAAWHQANASTANQVEFVLGLAEAPVHARVLVQATQGTLTAWGFGIALGLDSTTVPSGLWQMAAAWDNGGTIGPATLIATYDEVPAIGRHLLQWLEYGNAGGNTTFYGTSAPPGSGVPQAGIAGHIAG